MKKTTRTFIAFDINDQTRKELAETQEKLKKLLKGKISWVSPENMHLTLRFLGNIDNAQFELIRKVVSTVAKNIKQFNCDLGVLGVFPDTSNPRVLWAGINYGFNDICAVNAELENHLESIHFAEGEKYFHPHITLARIKSIDSSVNLQAVLEQIHPHSLGNLIDTVALFESISTDTGVEYKKLFETQLAR